MELLLLLLVIFLQLGGGGGGGRRRGWVWVTSGGRLLTPEQPQLRGNWALRGRSGESYWGSGMDGPTGRCLL